MADADDPECLARERNPLAGGDGIQGGKDIVHHAAGIATGRVADDDAVCGAPGQVDVVRTDRRRRDEGHPGPAEQRGVAMGPRPRQERVCVQQVGPRDGAAVLVNDLGVRFEYAFEERDGPVSDEFHFRTRLRI